MDHLILSFRFDGSLHIDAREKYNRGNPNRGKQATAAAVSGKTGVHPVRSCRLAKPRVSSNCKPVHDGSFQNLLCNSAPGQVCFDHRSILIEKLSRKVRESTWKK
jgi:hypothetical protein